MYRILSILILLTLGTHSLYAAEPPPARVVVEPIKEELISQSSRMVGIIDFDRVADVASEVKGIITSHQLTEGRFVHTGDVLVELNTDFIRQDIRIIETEIEQVEAEREKQQKNLKRLESLIESEATSRRAYEEILYSHQSLTKQRDALRLKIERLGLQIDKSRIRAPFDGVILEKYKELGEWTAPESPVAKIASSRDVIARVAVTETLIQFLNEGDKLHVDIPALNLTTRGTIRGFTPVADLRSKSLYLKVHLPYNKQMYQNMTARVEVPVSAKRKLRIIKRDAVVRAQGKEFIYTVDEGKAKMLPINIVTRMGDTVGVDNVNIKAGMPVVVDGNARLRPNQAVAPVDNKP